MGVQESLSELSGGQRSLLALSLILALLLFKPAPMYILDEIDAALDLSHTQNIGNMYAFLLSCSFPLVPVLTSKNAPTPSAPTVHPMAHTPQSARACCSLTTSSCSQGLQGRAYSHSPAALRGSTLPNKSTG